MSIINDALKKTQAGLEEKTGSPEPRRTEDPRSPNISPSLPAKEPVPIEKNPVVLSQPETSFPQRKTLASIEQEQKTKKTEQPLSQNSQAKNESSRNPADFPSNTGILFLSLILVLTATFFFYKNPLGLKFPRNPFKFKTEHSQTAKKKNFLGWGEKKPQERAQAVKKPTPGELTLGGVISQNGKQFALIDDEVYQEGSVIDGKKILSISLERVILEDNGKTITLLNKPAKKNTN